uniref:TSA: Wollemia nobilis Ref_Wollemi_Transcript_2310_1165 transcribed RNA sequence n=1 Tax=Wollemia nobilis TaxID=56998 RepID=A0A0C9QWZ6_9CONI
MEEKGMEGLTQRSKEETRQKPEKDEEDYSKQKKIKAGTAKKGIKSLLISVAIPLVLGILDAVFFSPNSDYYKQLKKPWWNPPGWLFGLAWTVLYALMGVASWLVWVEGGFQKQARPLIIYGVQLIINLLWPPIFFGLHRIGLALIDICLLDVAVIVCLSAFRSVKDVAGFLLTPYLGWVLFATFLNYRIYTLNGGSVTAPVEGVYT